MDRVILKDVRAGQVVRMLTGEGEQNFQYTFLVQKVGKLPLGILTQTNPDGTKMGSAEAELLGCGGWTTLAQNPMQRADWFIGRAAQERALTIGWGVLYVGGCAVVRNTNEAENTFYELQPEVTSITVGEVS